MLKGLFLNTRKAQCSIYEAGVMVYSALAFSDKYTLDYIEIDENHRTYPDDYDFYAFNYHPWVMNWLDTTTIQNLPGLKITFIFETLPNNPFPLCPSDAFDIYCAVDPTINVPDKRVYAFPRPLESPYAGELVDPVIPTIGTFGFATAGKGFEFVVDAVSNEFDEAIVRINIPTGTHIKSSKTIFPAKQSYADFLSERCYSRAGDGIDVQITHDYLTKPDLIKWCSENTLNVFMYNRNQPGLSATTDQAIASGRPLAVSANATFRHLHTYLKPYPERSLKESIELSRPEVLRMQRDWTAKNFALRFEQVLAENILNTNRWSGNAVTLKKKNAVKTFIDTNIQRVSFFLHPVDEYIPSTPTNKNIVLFVSQKEKKCGVYQYGKNITNSLRKSRKYRFIFCECGSRKDLDNAISLFNPKAIIYNYYPAILPWLTRHVTRSYPIMQLAIIHEFDQSDADATTNKMFDYSLYQDPYLIERNPYAIRTKQLVYPYVNKTPVPDIPTIGSFGFGFADKGFERLVATVQQEFDTAIINIHMASNDIVDKSGNRAKKTAQNCRDMVYKPGIILNITHEFLTEPELLDFLAGNTINCFFTDVNHTLGISGAIHHALAVHRPIAITKCPMYKDIWNAKPSICIEDSSLKEIITNGTIPLEPFYKEWSEQAFIADYERILGKVLA
jgi:hypothetical protein